MPVSRKRKIIKKLGQIAKDLHKAWGNLFSEAPRTQKDCALKALQMKLENSSKVPKPKYRLEQIDMVTHKIAKRGLQHAKQIIFPVYQVIPLKVSKNYRRQHKG